MLEEIIDSKTDGNVLGFFLAAPERSFSVLEISKRLRLPGGSASHSMAKLSSLGLLKTFSKKGKKYYLINSKYKLLPELKNQSIRAGIKYQDELFTAIKRLGDIKAAFLSGIFCGHATLPVDILLVGKVNLRKLSDFFKNLEKLMGQEINYSVMTVPEFLQRRNTFDRFIKDIFDYRHLVVVDTISSKKSTRKSKNVF